MLFIIFQMFKEIQQGFTRFSIDENEICDTCYNARLVKVNNPENETPRLQ